MNEANQNRQDQLLHFGDFALNVVRRGLYRGQERVRLTAKPLETLIFLVENRGRVVEKQEILSAVWKGTFVTEDTLVHAIREIRRALGDDRDNPRFILTVPREGYRFVCEVLVESEPAPSSTDETTSIDDSPELAAPLPPKPAGIVDQPRTRSWVLPVFLGLLLLAPTIWIASKFVSRVGPQETAKPPNLDSQKLLTTTAFSEGKPALSLDGTLLLYISTNPDENEKTNDGKIKTFGDLFVKQLSSGNPVQITHKENPSGDIPVFTADNSFVVFSNYPRTDKARSLLNLYKVPAYGGRAYRSDDEPVPYITEASGAGFSPDEKWVAYTKHLQGRKALWLSPANNPEADHKEIADNGFTPRWSADGKWLAYTTSNPNGGPGDIWVVDGSSFTGARNLTNEPQQIYGLTWTPDNRFLVFSSKRMGPSLLWRVPFEGGPAQPLTGSAGDFSTPSMSGKGNMLVFSYYRGAQNLFIAEGLNAQARDLTKDEYHEFVRLSPSGEYVATVRQKPGYGEHLYVTDLRGNPTCLSDHASRHPSWSSAKKVSYLQTDQSGQQTHVIQVNIENLEKPVAQPVTMFPGKADWLDIDPADATKLVVVLSVNGKQEIVLRDLERKQPDVVIAEGLEYASLRWSADGSTLAWSGPEEAGPESTGIWVIKLGVDTKPRLIVPNGFGPVWRADNSVIYFGRLGAQSGLFEFDMKTNKEKLIRDWEQTDSFDVIGQRLVYSELGSTGKSRVYSLTLE